MVHAKKLHISQNVDHRWGMIFFCKLDIKQSFWTNEVLVIAGSNIFVQCICHSYLTKPHWPQTSSPFEDVVCWGASCIIRWIQMGHGFFGDDRAGEGKRIRSFPFYCQSWKIGLPQNNVCTYLKEMHLCIQKNYEFDFFEHLEFINSKVLRYTIFNFAGI